MTANQEAHMLDIEVILAEAADRIAEKHPVHIEVLGTTIERDDDGHPEYVEARISFGRTDT